MKIEFEIKMSGRKGTGHYESGSIETLLEKNKILEQRINDMEMNMNDIKDIKEALKEDVKIADMIKKYKEITMEDKPNVHMIEDVEKIKKSMVKIKEDDLNDVTDKVDAIASRMNNNRKINDHNIHLKSLIKNLEDKIDDKFENQFEKLKKLKDKFEGEYVMKENQWDFKNDIMKDLNRMIGNSKDKQRDFGQETNKGEDKGRQGNTNNTPAQFRDGTPIVGDGSIPQNLNSYGHEPSAERNQIPPQDAKLGSPPRLCSDGSGPGQSRAVPNFLDKKFNTDYYNIHSPIREQGSGHEDVQRQANMPMNNGEINSNRNKEKGLEKLDGKASEFKPWRRRMTNYI